MSFEVAPHKHTRTSSENMSFWECPDCGRVDHIFGKEGVSEEAKKRKLPLLGKIPLHSDIREASDGGSPTVISSPKSVQAKSYREISQLPRDSSIRYPSSRITRFSGLGPKQLRPPSCQRDA